MSLTATTLPYQRDTRSRTIGADDGGAAVAISGPDGTDGPGGLAGFDLPGEGGGSGRSTTSVMS
jgi:hypothetical protein